MIFNLFKKKENSSKTYEGRFVTDEDIEKMVKPKKGSIFENDVNSVNDMLNDLKNLMENGGE